MKILRDYQQKIVDNVLKELKSSDNPILIDASVGSGKSLILSSVLLVMEHAGYHSLCLTLNSTLIQQNADTYQFQGGNPGIYCAGLNAKETEHIITFASPHSVCQDIRNKGDISRQPFKLIIIDEVHNLNFHDPSSMYMRIINHYSMLAQIESYEFRIIGLSGTCYRNKSESIVGPKMMFKSKLCSISTSWLIEQGFLTRPHFGIVNKGLDFSALRVNNMGQFNGKELQAVIDKSHRLTGEIMQELQQLDCKGIFIFASTKKHCDECLRALPYGQGAIITGDTPHHERKRILDSARQGTTRYLISVGCLTVGVDVPLFDVCAWLRPTESLVLYTQGIGRVLRLHPSKSMARILDYSGNLERHGDIDDPIINEALKPTEENEKDYCIPCYTCNTNNTIHARRCIGIKSGSGDRCDYFFEFKECSNCAVQNDVTSRQCRGCNAELIDPNAKLSRIKAETYTLNVTSASYCIVPQGHTSFPIINIAYDCTPHRVFESYYTNTEKAKNIMYSKFIRLHVEKPSDYYMHLSNIVRMKEMIVKPMLTPSQLVCIKNEHGFYKIVKKIFA